jgi:endonuclease-3
MARTESPARRRQRVVKIVAILRKQYPQAKVRLSYRTPLHLLVATILAAQCTDDRVNQITPELFDRYPDAASLAAASQEDMEELIRSAGFFRNKSRAIRGAAARIAEHFGGEVPDAMEDLLSLPGVARKTANVVLSNAYGKNEGVTVDTHVLRVAPRLGLTRHSDPVRVERDLMEIVPREDWGVFSHLLIFHGRAICAPRKPRCGECPINKLCPSAFTF